MPSKSTSVAGLLKLKPSFQNILVMPFCMMTSNIKSITSSWHFASNTSYFYTVVISLVMFKMDFFKFKMCDKLNKTLIH